jgi:cAMP phosphodiesterase
MNDNRPIQYKVANPNTYQKLFTEPAFVIAFKTAHGSIGAYKNLKK